MQIPHIHNSNHWLLHTKDNYADINNTQIQYNPNHYTYIGYQVSIDVSWQVINPHLQLMHAGTHTNMDYIERY